MFYCQYQDKTLSCAFAAKPLEDKKLYDKKYLPQAFEYTDLEMNTQWCSQSQNHLSHIQPVPGKQKNKWENKLERKYKSL